MPVKRRRVVVPRQRLIAQTLLCVLAVSSIAACTSAEEPKSEPSVSVSPSVAPTPVDLRLMVYGADDTVEVYQQIATAFSAANPHVNIDLDSRSDAASAAESALGAIATGVDAPDVFLLDLAQLPDAVAAEALHPVNELLEARDVPFGDGVQRAALTAYSVDNALACMPAEVSPEVVYYNKALVKPRVLRLQMNPDADPDPANPTRAWSWDMFVNAARQSVGGGAPGTYLAPDLNLLQAFLASVGGSAVDDDREPTTLTLSSSESRDALKQLATLTRERGLTLRPRQAERDSPLERFKRGELGMLIGTRALVPELRVVSGLKFDVTPLPSLRSGVNISSMSAYCIGKDSANVEAAADFLAFATVGEGAEIAARSGRMVPVDLDVLHSEAFTQPGQLPASAVVYAEAARRAMPIPYSIHWENAAASAGPALTRVLFGATLDVSSDDTPALDALLEQVDTESVPIFTPPEPSPDPEP